MTEYRVGYRKPPLKSRFKPGKSGNPKGRPIGSRNLIGELKHELSRQVTVRENGQTKRISKRRAILMSLANKALGGDVKATSVIVAMVEGFDSSLPELATATVDADELRILRRYAPRVVKEATRKEKRK